MPIERYLHKFDIYMIDKQKDFPYFKVEFLFNSIIFNYIKDQQFY